METSTEKTPVRRRVLGIILGLAVGLLVDSSMVVDMRLPILFLVVASFGLVLIAPLALGI